MATFNLRMNQFDTIMCCVHVQSAHRSSSAQEQALSGLHVTLYLMMRLAICWEALNAGSPHQWVVCMRACVCACARVCLPSRNWCFCYLAGNFCNTRLSWPWQAYICSFLFLSRNVEHNNCVVDHGKSMLAPGFLCLRALQASHLRNAMHSMSRVCAHVSAQA